ncbi:hypothetical protein [Altererythrobacter sp. ZODW24]|uniref:hypothetical protein n=1 Tax=Altererythrobacter sp. ZODW24 TaxID=2185142 RepID=UPI000DF7F96E|nr:hypothetical protein [Altererythrobacter sp. ZODW24]
MRIDPALCALRSDPAPQRLAQARIEQAKQAWQGGPLVAGVAAGLKLYSGGEHLNDCGELAALFAKQARGPEYVSKLMDHFLVALAEEPLGQMPFRHDFREGYSTLVLATEGSATLSLHCSVPEANTAASPASSVRFSSGERHEVAIAGRADIRLIERKLRTMTPASMTERVVQTEAGDVLALDSDLQATIIDKIYGRLLRLRLVRAPSDPAPSQQYLIETGELIHQAAGDQGESRQELMLALLGRMKRADAAPIMAEMTNEGGDHLRWQAQRECLALDAASGFAALSKMAENTGDSLATPACALRAQLLETYPALEALNQETAPCPA